MGTGDGRAVLAAAAGEPTTLALGIDASGAAMAEASRRAARPARKGGLDNVRFVLAAAESLPPALAGRATLVTVTFPWGSLLRGCVGLDDAVAAGVAGLVALEGCLELLLAPADRDGLEGVPTTAPELVHVVTQTFARHGLELVEGRAATTDEIRNVPSTWARRLLNGGRHARGVTLVRLARGRDIGLDGLTA